MINIIKFESAHEVAEHIRKNAVAGSYAEQYNRPDFCRDSMAKALRNCGGQEIYGEGKTVKMADEMLDVLKALDDGKNNNMPEVIFDVCGQECDIERYMNGEPENMRNFEPSTEKRRLNLVIMPVVPHYITQESQEARGAAFIALVDRLLEMNKFIVCVNVPIALNLRGDTHIFIINFDLSKIISRQALAYLVTAPSVTRRIMFSLLEMAAGQANLQGEGYGQCQTFKEIMSTMKRCNQADKALELFGEAEGRIVYDTMYSDTDVKQEIKRIRNSVRSFSAAKAGTAAVGGDYDGNENED
jgi:hypothetical protein